MTCCCRDTPWQGDTYALSYFKKYLEENCWDHLGSTLPAGHLATLGYKDGVFG